MSGHWFEKPYVNAVHLAFDILIMTSPLLRSKLIKITTTRARGKAEINNSKSCMQSAAWRSYPLTLTELTGPPAEQGLVGVEAGPRPGRGVRTMAGVGGWVEG